MFPIVCATLEQPCCGSCSTQSGLRSSKPSRLRTTWCGNPSGLRVLARCTRWFENCRHHHPNPRRLAWRVRCASPRSTVSLKSARMSPDTQAVAPAQAWGFRGQGLGVGGREVTPLHSAPLRSAPLHPHGP